MNPSSQQIHVYATDDHEVVTRGVEAMLLGVPDIEIVAETFLNETNMLDRIGQVKPNVLLLDAKMPGFDLLNALEGLNRSFPAMKTIIVSAHQEASTIRAAAQRGAAGYLLKEEALSLTLAMAIRAVFNGRRWFSPVASHQLLAGESLQPLLSDYQTDILRLMMNGMSPEQIAAHKQRSVSAIYSAQTQIRNKFAVQTNEQTVVQAIKQGIVKLELVEI